MKPVSCRFVYPKDVVDANASVATCAIDIKRTTSCLPQYQFDMMQHPAYGLMHLAGKLKESNHSCAAAHAIVSAIEIATSHEEQQKFAMQLIWMLKTTLGMSNVDIIEHGIPPLHEDDTHICNL